jgi:hypothetical protein
MCEKEIYFSKIIFVQHRHSGNTYIQINLHEHEFSVQSCTYSLDPRAKYEMPTTVYVGKDSKIDLISPAVKISHGKNDFIPTLIPEECEEKCTFSYGSRINEDLFGKLKPFCKAMNFQLYINKKVNNDWAPYRDEYTMHFYGFTDSHIPYMHFDMTYFHSKWPTEKLWTEICNHLIKPNKKLKNIVIC